MENPSQEDSAYAGYAPEQHRRLIDVLTNDVSRKLDHKASVTQKLLPIPVLSPEELDSCIEQAIEKGMLKRPITSHVRDSLLHYESMTDETDLLSDYLNILPTEWLVRGAEVRAGIAFKAVLEIAKRKDFKGLVRIFNAHGFEKLSSFEEAFYNALMGRLLQEFSPEDGAELLYAISKEVARHEDAVHHVTHYSENMILHKRCRKFPRDLDDYRTQLDVTEGEEAALQGEKLSLIGGGYSMIKHELRERNLECEITNIDPLIDEDEPDIAHKIIKKSFFEVDVPLHEQKEVWALFSLPMYAFTPGEVAEFYAKGLSLLKQGGTLRVLSVSETYDSLTPSMALSRPITNLASEKCINILMTRPDLFDVRPYSSTWTRPEYDYRAEKTKTPGCKIVLVGNPEEADRFLETIPPEFKNFIVSEKILREFRVTEN